ncbi:MAG: SxtJ family membrane protein [Candidatus Azotimanducaceae bacterium]
MGQSEINLPSNERFGFFFTIVCAIVTVYFYFEGGLTWVYFFGAASLSFFVAAIVKPDALYPLNILWMRLGSLLGVIVAPAVLGVVFFGLFTPIAFFMRLSGRDELLLKPDNKSQPTTHWVPRGQQVKADSFKRQF